MNSRLKSDDINFLSDQVLKLLKQNRIVTILDFLHEDVSKLSLLTKLTMPEVLSARNEIFIKYSAPLVNGSMLLAQRLASRKFINTGIESLNHVIGGGIPTGYITELCGLADSGKTQLCLQLAINHVKYSDNSILYVDTKGDFSAVRVQKILNASKFSHKEMAIIMHKIKVVHIWSLEELIDLMSNLKNKLLVIENLSLIIIDSLPCLLFQYIGDENKIGLSLLNTLVNYCRYLSIEYDLGVICINIYTRWVDQDNNSDIEDDDDKVSIFKENTFVEKKNRCLGKYWQHIPALILSLEKIQENDNQDQSKDSSIKVTTIKTTKVNKDLRYCILNINDSGVT